MRRPTSALEYLDDICKLDAYVCTFISACNVHQKYHTAALHLLSPGG
jgi:hypothetical protein